MRASAVQKESCIAAGIIVLLPEIIAEMMLLKMVLVVGLCWLSVADQQPTLLQPTHCWFLVKNETDDLQTPKNTI